LPFLTCQSLHVVSCEDSNDNEGSKMAPRTELDGWRESLEDLTPGLVEHVTALYEGDPLPVHYDRPRFEMMERAIALMTKGEKLEWVKGSGRGPAQRTACEVVAFYELEGFVAGHSVAA
jgi:hypothetical protein